MVKLIPRQRFKQPPTLANKGDDAEPAVSASHKIVSLSLDDSGLLGNASIAGHTASFCLFGHGIPPGCATSGTCGCSSPGGMTENKNLPLTQVSTHFAHQPYPDVVRVPGPRGQTSNTPVMSQTYQRSERLLRDIDFSVRSTATRQRHLAQAIALGRVDNSLYDRKKQPRRPVELQECPPEAETKNAAARPQRSAR